MDHCNNHSCAVPIEIPVFLLQVGGLAVSVYTQGGVLQCLSFLMVNSIPTGGSLNASLEHHLLTFLLHPMRALFLSVLYQHLVVSAGVSLLGLPGSHLPTPLSGMMATTSCCLLP